VDYQVVWTNPAITNLEEIFEHIVDDNPNAAKKFVLHLIEHAESLEVLPLRGKVYPRFGEGYIREIPYRGYRIFYKVYEKLKRVDILQVWHGSRDEPNLLNT